MSIWQGERVRLRAVEPEDWEMFWRWNQDDAQARSLDFIPFPLSRAATRQQVAGYAIGRALDDAFRFMIEDAEGQLVGGIATHDCDRRVGAFSYGLNILAEHRRKGYASGAVRIVARYFFRELRYQKVTVGIYDFNAASLRLHESLGFQSEGRLRRVAYTNGQHHDLLMYGITTEEFTARYP